MKAKMNFKAKRTIIIASILAVLAVAAGVGGYFYIKGNNDTAAVDNAIDATTSVDGLPEAGKNKDKDKKSDNKKEDSNKPADGENTDANTPQGGANGNARTPTGTANGDAGTPAGRTGNGTGTVRNANNNNAADTDATTVIETQSETIVVEDPWESHLVKWTPEGLKTDIGEISITKPKLESKKYAYVNGDSIENLPVNTAVQKGGKITYVIEISNAGNTDASKVMVYDEIPEGTKIKDTNGGTIQTIKGEDGKEVQRIVFEKDVAAGKTEKVSFTVEVVKDITLIKNKAKVNGEDTPETKTPVVTSNKKSYLVIGEEEEREEVELEKGQTVEIGDKVKYEITVTNTSEIEAITTISDKVPAGTENPTNITCSVEGVEGKEDNGTITWENVKVEAGKTVTVSFDVTVSSDTTKTIKNIAVVAGTDTPPVENPVANIKLEKKSSGEGKTLKEWDEITYTITATNIGDGAKEIEISDEVPEGTTLKAGSITQSGTESNGVITWTVNVPAQSGDTPGKVEVSFTVTIDPFEANKDEEGNPIDTIKEIVNDKVKKDGIPQDTTTTDEAEKEFVNLVVNKEFVEQDNYTELRPGTLDIKLLADNKEKATKTMTIENGKGTVTFDKLDKYVIDANTKTAIVYTATEVEDENYTASYNRTHSGNTVTVKVTNTLKNDKIKVDVPVTKVWSDNNKTGVESIGVKLEGNNNTYTGTIKESEDWKTVIEDVQKYPTETSTTPITYTVTETGIPEFYTSTVTGNIVNGYEIYNELNDPDLTLDKKVSLIDANGRVIKELSKTDTVEAGDNIRYTITAENKTTQSTIQDITDEVPAGTENARNITCSEQGITGTNVDGKITWKNVPIKAGKTVTVTFDVTISSSTTAKVRNVAKVGDDDTPPTENPVANIKLEKKSSGEGKTLKEMDEITYTITATNTGDGAKEIEISDEVPEGTTLKAGSITQNGTESNGVITWTVNVPAKSGDTPGKAEVSFTVTIDPFEANKDEEGNPIDTTKEIVNDKVKKDGIPQDTTTTDEAEKEFVNLVVNKEFVEQDNYTELRPGTLDIKLLADNKEKATKTMTIENGEGTVTFDKLDKYVIDGDTKTAIVYTATEVEDENYTASYSRTQSGNTVTVKVTNTLKNDKIKVDVPVEKIWSDNNKTGVESIGVKLEGNNNTYTGTIKESEDWKTVIEDVQKYPTATSTTPIEYTVTESNVPDFYTTTVTGDIVAGYTITNTLNNPDLELTKTASLIDGNGRVIKQLTNNDTVEVGEHIRYTITAENKAEKSTVQDITDEVPAGTENARNITCSVEGITGTNVNGIITWKNVPIAAGKTVTVTFDVTVSSNTTEKVRNVAKVGDNDTPPTENQVANIKLEKKSSGEGKTLKEMDEITYTITATNTGDGAKEIEISDEVPEGTTLKAGSITQNGTESNGVITWTVNVPAKSGDTPGKVEVSFTVTINSFGATDEGVTYNEDTMVATKQIINNKVKKDGEPQDVTTTDTVEKEFTTFTANKVWNDDNDRDKLRPTSVSIQLSANGTAKGNPVTLNEENNWTYTWDKLDKMENGTEITYTIDEPTVPEHYNKESVEGGTITNKYVPEKTTYSVEKVWNDEKDQDGIRPDSVSVQLYADGEAEGDPITLNSANSWKHTWTGLNKKSDGTDIVYSADEVTVPTGYTRTFDGNKIVNTHTPEMIQIPVTKVWEDYDNYFDARKSVEIEIKDGDNVVDTITLTASDESAKNEWSKVSKKLPKYRNGEEIQYTVSEGKIERYELKGITGNQTKGFRITNTYDNVIINRMVYTSTDINTKEAKVDIVFVLDISGSMDNEIPGTGHWQYNPRTGYNEWVADYNDRAKNAVAAINKAMKSIFEKNPENRVGVVVYSSDKNMFESTARPNGTVLLPLDSYQPKNLASNSESHEYLSFDSKDGDGNDVITTNVNKVNSDGTTTAVTNKSVTVRGGTYTQDGIKKGAELLTGAEDITYKIEGDDTEYTRAPVLILLTDGEPTVGNSSPNVNGTTSGTGASYDTAYGVGTIKTAAYYKKQITNHYYPNGLGEAQIFTIGYDIDDLYIKAILNPTQANINDCRNSSTSNDTWQRDRALAEELGTSGRFTYNGNRYNYSYASGSYTGEMNEAQLNTILADIESQIKHYTPVTTYTTNIERDPALAKLENIDINMDVTIKLDGIETTKSVEQWMSAENNSVIVKDGDEYYVNLLAVGLKTAKSIEITYFEIEGSTPTLNTVTRVFHAHAPYGDEEIDEEKALNPDELKEDNTKAVENKTESKVETNQKDDKAIKNETDIEKNTENKVEENKATEKTVEEEKNQDEEIVNEVTNTTEDKSNKTEKENTENTVNTVNTTTENTVNNNTIESNENT